ncbi:MarR family transcriptional regulator [Tistrella bauzanensis]|uniref:MarR family transcriptional regulator n=1 Tax=Tistrella arctica TaxID=3133430 RepID=A0ABU9YPQ6_9PROT
MDTPSTARPPEMLRADFATELSTAGRRMRTVFDGLVRKRGLTLSRARALLLLQNQRAMNQTELAGLLEIEGPTVVRLLDGLEKQGLITRSTSGHDRRVKQIKLTDAARAQVAEVEAIVETVRAAMLNDIEDAELDAAMRVLSRVIHNLDTAF